MKTYKEANTQWTETSKRKLQNNTYLTKTENGYGIKLHDTIIVEYTPQKTILNSNGWQTVTTKSRMNNYMPSGYSLYQEQGIWFIAKHGEWENSLPYADGCFFDGKEWNGLREDPKKTQRLRKQIRKYSKDFVKALTKRQLSAPDGGDCWCCALKDQNGKTMGDNDPSHIISHIDEKYYVPSLCINAIETFPISPIAKSALGYYLNMHEQEPMGWNNIAKNQIEKSIKRYCYRQLGLPT